MPMNYKIPAIPTIYMGRQYRSRLEARWAAFFDLLGWHVEYEPCDLGAWSPDFALRGRRMECPIYVEVKPIHHWDRDIARKMADTAEWGDGNILLLGVSPTFGMDSGSFDRIGWYADMGFSFEAHWAAVGLGTLSDGTFDMTAIDDRLCQQSLLLEQSEVVRPGSTEKLWIEAANIVQWQARRK